MSTCERANLVISVAEGRRCVLVALAGATVFTTQFGAAKLYLKTLTRTYFPITRRDSIDSLRSEN